MQPQRLLTAQGGIALGGACNCACDVLFVLWHQHPDATTKFENHLRYAPEPHVTRPRPDAASASDGSGETALRVETAAHPRRSPRESTDSQVSLSKPTRTHGRGVIDDLFQPVFPDPPCPATDEVCRALRPDGQPAPRGRPPPPEPHVTRPRPDAAPKASDGSGGIALEGESLVWRHRFPPRTTIENHLRCFTPLRFRRPQPGRPDAQP